MNEPGNNSQRSRTALRDGRQRTPQAYAELNQTLRQQIRRWPLATIGAAIVAGYLVGRRETIAARNSGSIPASDWMASGNTQTSNTRGSQNSAERARSAHVPVVDGQDTLWYVSDSDGSPGQRQARDSTLEHQGRVPSEAPNASFAAGSGATGFDSPPITSSYLSNIDVGGPEEGQPYFPPGGAPDRDRSGPEQGDDSA